MILSAIVLCSFWNWIPPNGSFLWPTWEGLELHVNGYFYIEGGLGGTAALCSFSHACTHRMDYIPAFLDWYLTVTFNLRTSLVHSSHDVIIFNPLRSCERCSFSSLFASQLEAPHSKCCQAPCSYMLVHRQSYLSDGSFKLGT